VNQKFLIFLIDVDSMIPRIGVVNRLPSTLFVRISTSDIRLSS
jgi:hypothetical protein